VSGIANLSNVALLKRLRTSRVWLRWIAAQLSQGLRSGELPPEGMRIRAIDSTSINGPKSKGTDWRVHYTLDLVTMACDWHEVTDRHGGEQLERAPIERGDLVIGDRNFAGESGIRHVTDRHGHVLVRMRWHHAPMVDTGGRDFRVLRWLRSVRLGPVYQRAVRLVGKDDQPSVAGRVIAVKLPRPLAKKAQDRILSSNRRKMKKTNPKTLDAAKYVFVFTTLPERMLSAKMVLELYRFRWQIELAFKRLKQILKLGRLPHQDPAAAEALILSKLVVALLLETFYRRATTFSPWGYRLDQSAIRAA
jgi:IS4 transposase